MGPAGTGSPQPGFVHWAAAGPSGASGTLLGVDVVLTGPMGTAFYLHDDYPNFDWRAFTPQLPATGMVEMAGGAGHAFTLAFGGPVQDPVLLLGSLGSVLTFAPGTTVTRISGDGGFQVAGWAVTGDLEAAVPLGDGTLGPTDANGTVRLTGVFSSVTFTLVPLPADTSGQDGVFLQVGGVPLSTPGQLTESALALVGSAAVARGDINALALELAGRAVAEATAGLAAAAAVSQRAAAEVFSGEWSDPVPPPGGDPAVVVAVTHAQDSWRAATAARARIGAYVEQFHTVVERLAGTGDPVPPGLAQLTDSLSGSVSLCDFDGGFADAVAGPLTFGGTKGTWTRGALRVSVDPTGCVFPGATDSVNPTSVIQRAFTLWQQVSVVRGRDFFQLTPVGTGQPAEIQVTFVDPSTFMPPPPPGKMTAGTSLPPEHGIMRLDNSRSWSESELLSIALHEAGHILGLAHSNVPGTLMFPTSSFVQVVDELAREAFALLYGWLPRQDQLDRATNDRPSLHVVSRGATPDYVPQMVWRGSLDDASMWHARFVNREWTAQQPLGIGDTSYSPALTAVDGGSPGVDIGTRLLMAWRGPGDIPGIFWSRQAAPDGPFRLGDGRTSHPVPGVGTSAAPSLATLNDTVFMVWKGAGNDERIWFASLDDAATGEVWSGQSPISGVLTSGSPALVAWHGQLHMFWKGGGNDARLWHAVRGPADTDIWGEQRQVTYGAFEAVGSVVVPALTDAAPAATARPDDIMVAWKGQGERPVHVTLFDGVSFCGQAPILQSGSVAGPALAATPEASFAAWRGNEGDRTLHWTVIDTA